MYQPINIDNLHCLDVSGIFFIERLIKAIQIFESESLAPFNSMRKLRIALNNKI